MQVQIHPRHWRGELDGVYVIFYELA